MDKKYIECNLPPKEIFTILFKEGLKIAEREKKGKIITADAMVLLFFFMRPFKEYDFKVNKNKILEDFVENGEIDDAAFKDMSHVIHCAYEEDEHKSIIERKAIEFQTSMPFKVAIRIFVSLAISVLGEDIVEKIMDKTDFEFEKYGSKDGRKRYEDKCKKKNFEPVKLEE